jgi:hypothetical protein
MKEAVEEDMTDAQTKFGIKKPIDNNQKGMVKKAKSRKAASEAIYESLERTENKL